MNNKLTDTAMAEPETQKQIVTYDSNDIVSEDAIRTMIMPVRGVQVMLDRDLAALYGVEVKYLNRQVKRNIERFPSDFMFQLTKEDCLRCQIGTLNGKRGEHLKYMPYAFTENGIAMLSGVLRSSIAIEINIRIMRAFVAMRRVLANVEPLLSRIESVERRQITGAQCGKFTKTICGICHDRRGLRTSVRGSSLKDVGRRWCNGC